MEKDALISDCGRYRYWLTRTWGTLRPACFIMLNPSTADASVDDPTIRRCIGFAKAWGCSGITVVNLFAFRATDPKKMKAVNFDAIGPENDRHIKICVASAGITVCAWGAHGGFLGRDQEVKKIARSAGSLITQCLGRTKDGYPKHPLYVPNSAKLEYY